MNLRDKVELHKRWWARTNDAPLVGPYVPLDMPFGGLDINVPPARMAERALRNAEVAHHAPGDMLVVARANFSVAHVPAIAGAGFQYDEHTSWSVPVASSISELRVKPFDPNHPLFIEYVRRLEPLLEHWSWDTYLPGLDDYLGPLDVLAGLLGPGNLAIAMMEEPDEVKKHAMDAAQTVRDMLHYELRLHREAGLTEGVTDGFSVWLPGAGVRMSEDFSALVGDRQFREFFIEPDSLIYESVDSSFLHVHSAAHRCMPGILDCRKLGAIEFGNDPNGPDLDTRIACGRMVQEKGLPLQMGSWNMPLEEGDVRKLVTSLDPRGLIVRLQAESIEHANELNAMVIDLCNKPAPGSAA
ncbi:MAG: hypothetical protein GXX96_07405 [Planctomycetaceae bacterium]|nr:hypothetical protein [Planctomycetaceae bacterium]